jgi:hypothetical protein
MPKNQWESKHLHEHPTNHQKGTWGKICLSEAGVYYLKVGGSHMSCPPDWASRIQAEEEQGEADQQYMLRIDPDIYRRAKAKATLEKMTLKELFEMLLQKYLAEKE